MGLKRYLKAAFQTRNLILLAAVIIISFLTEYIPFTLIGMAGYVYFVLQTLRDEKFTLRLAEEQDLYRIETLSMECRNLYKMVYREIGSISRKKLKGIMQQKQNLLEYYKKNSDDTLNKKIMEQALQLVMAYIKLLHNYNIRYKDVSSINVNDIHLRINKNNRKLGSLKNYDAVLELTKAIEMDENLVKRIQEEKNELEMVSVKLDHIESMIAAFKHQIISSDMANPAAEEIESVVNEATALDTVLTERKRQRL